VARVHPTAVVDRHAEIDADVEIGPYCVVSAGVRIAAGTRLLSHVVVRGDTSIGKNNTFHPFAAIGGEAQTRKDLLQGARSRPALVIGDENVFRESVTVNVSTSERATTIGSNNLLMAGCHVAHDVRLGSRCVVANAVQIAGHCTIDDWVTFGGLSGLAQRVHVGEGAFVAAGAMCERDVPPFVIVQGDRARVRALNVVGLERRGVPASSIGALKDAFARAFVRRGRPFADAVRELDRSDPFVDRFAAALSRGVGSLGHR
jgi:UDP-N-acetylglucosamine acyltransferase